MPPLSRTSILAAADRPLKPLSIPEWGGDVFIRTMSGAERDSFDAETVAASKEGGAIMTNMRARMAVRVVCDAEGARLFSDADAAALGAKSSRVLDRIFIASREANVIGADAVAEAGNDSAPTPSGASGSV